MCFWGCVIGGFARGVGFCCFVFDLVLVGVFSGLLMCGFMVLLVYCLIVAFVCCLNRPEVWGFRVNGRC